MSFHDEPLVVDNGPLGIDVGQRHEDEGLLEQVGTRDWKRKVSQFNKIVLIRKTSNGNPTFGAIDTRIASLSREDGADITLTLSNGSSTLKLSFTGEGHDELMIKPNDFNFTKQGRRLNHNNLRITRVEWFEAGQTSPTQFPAGATQNHESIFVGLYP